ncbi:MAG: hypothetical protein WCJ74_01515 [bacterium]
MQIKKGFNANPHKSANKVTINSFMMGSLFFILTLVIAIDPNKFSPFVIYQLVLAIPLLFVSSLAYSKIGYSKDTHNWDILGWHTNNLGNLFVLNSVGLVAGNYDLLLAKIYFTLFCFLMTIYTLININHEPKSWPNRVYKLFFLLIVTILGGVLIIL